MTSLTIDSYKNRAGRLDLTGIDFDVFSDRPLAPDALRCLRYMHDVEHHTVCYLRDLLLTPAHRDPDVTAFLACWVFEELWHGEAIGAVLRAHGEEAGALRIAALRRRRRRGDSTSMMVHQAAAGLAGDSFVGVHMAWGAVNEWTTQAGYARLSALAGHPVLGDLLARIMTQEGRHIAFYASEATRRLASSGGSRWLARQALSHFWRPVGAGVMPDEEVSFLVRYLFSGHDGAAAVARIDRRVDRLPGLSGLALVSSAVARLSAPDRIRRGGRSSVAPPRSPQLEPGGAPAALDHHHDGAAGAASWLEPTGSLQTPARAPGAATTAAA